MDNLEKKLIRNSDYSTYKNIKNSIIARYPNHHGKIFFKTPKGLIAYIDSTINKYAARYSESDFNTLPEFVNLNLSNISSFTSSPKDAEILSTVLLDFFVNAEAAIVNGGVKFAVYSVMLSSDFTDVTLIGKQKLANILDDYLPSIADNVEGAEAYEATYDALNFTFNNYKADLLFGIISAVFAYTRKLLVLFSRQASEDKRLKDVSYKQSTATFQTLVNSLLNILIADYFTQMRQYFYDLGDVTSSNYLLEINNDVYTKIRANLPSIYANNLYSLQDSLIKIASTLVSEIEESQLGIIPDLTYLKEFLNEINPILFVEDKQGLIDRVYSYLLRSS